MSATFAKQKSGICWISDARRPRSSHRPSNSFSLEKHCSFGANDAFYQDCCAVPSSVPIAGNADVPNVSRQSQELDCRVSKYLSTNLMNAETPTGPSSHRLPPPHVPHTSNGSTHSVAIRQSFETLAFHDAQNGQISDHNKERCIQRESLHLAIRQQMPKIVKTSCFRYAATPWLIITNLVWLAAPASDITLIRPQFLFLLQEFFLACARSVY